MKSGCDSEKVTKKRSIELPVLQSSQSANSGIGKSNASRWRAGALILLQLLMIAHIVQWRFMGETITPIEPSEAMYTLQSGAVNAGFIFFSLAILVTLIFGRFVCGWGCHILALQDFCAWLLTKFGLKPRPFRSRLLVFIPLIVALYMFVWPTVSRALAAPKNEPLIPQFTNHLVTTEFWATFPPVWVAIPFLFVVGFMTVYFLGSKGFCTYGCPYGGFFNLADKVAPGKIRVTDACNECGHCTAVCTSNVLVHAEVKQYGMVVDSGCMKCMDCISVCPNDALYFGFGKPAIAVSKSISKNYSLTWPEEIFGVFIFAASFFAVWDVYQLVPMLMALGIAIITTFLALRLIRLLNSTELSFYRYRLKSSGTIQFAGWIFIALSAAWVGLNIHSGWIRYNERAGAAAFQNIQIPDELALARIEPGQWLSATDQRQLAFGRKHFSAAADAGIFTNAEALSKHAWVEYLSGNTENALRLLNSAAEHQTGQAKAMSFYYRGAILNRMGRYTEAMSDLDNALNERPDLVLAREEKGESHWRRGQKEQAVAAWTDAVERNPALPVANYMLGGAAGYLGNPEAAAAYEKQGDKLSPADPRFYWMVGLRLQNVGMNALAEKQFERAIRLDPQFKARRLLESNRP